MDFNPDQNQFAEEVMGADAVASGLLSRDALASFPPDDAGLCVDAFDGQPGVDTAGEPRGVGAEPRVGLTTDALPVRAVVDGGNGVAPDSDIEASPLSSSSLSAVPASPAGPPRPSRRRAMPQSVTKTSPW